jgi:hypothetical protein
VLRLKKKTGDSRCALETRRGRRTPCRSRWRWRFLYTVFNNLAKRAHPRPGQIPTVSKNVRGHLVYDSTASSFMILQMTEDAPYSLTIERAEAVAARHHQAK